MANNELEKSFETLKETIPLLLKHKISAVPTNYALWYTYVSNESEQLNKAVDEAQEQGQPLSQLKTKELYRSYLAESQEVNGWQLRQSMEAMLLELSQSMKDTRTDTNEFKQAMDARLADLDRVEKEGWSVEEVMKLVRNMVSETQEVRKSTISFNGALASAEKEIERLKSALQESQQEALYDALTGLCNRRYFDSELESKMAMDCVSLIIIDIDHFKKVNDTHGHQMGDLVLKAVAKKVQTCCRDAAQVFRFGGEEFAVLAPNMDAKRTIHLANQMRRAVEKINVKNRRTGESLDDITISLGVAQKQNDESQQSLLARADELLYEAKRLGRNRVMPI